MEIQASAERHDVQRCPELHFAFSPVLLGRGEAMFEGLNLPALGYRVMEPTATDLATHVVLGREESE